MRGGQPGQACLRASSEGMTCVTLETSSQLLIYSDIYWVAAGRRQS